MSHDARRLKRHVFFRIHRIVNLRDRGSIHNQRLICRQLTAQQGSRKRESYLNPLDLLAICIEIGKPIERGALRFAASASIRSCCAFEFDTGVIRAREKTAAPHSESEPQPRSRTCWPSAKVASIFALHSDGSGSRTRSAVPMMDEAKLMSLLPSEATGRIDSHATGSSDSAGGGSAISALPEKSSISPRQTPKMAEIRAQRMPRLNFRFPFGLIE